MLKIKRTRKVRVMETEVYSRVVGYYRPVKNWNVGKQLEFSERKLIDASKYEVAENKAAVRSAG